MELTAKLLGELQKRLKIGNRRGVHLNAIPSNSRYKFDLHRLSYIEKSMPGNFINALLTENPMKFRVSWKDNVPDLNSLFEEDQSQLIKITKSFENLISQTETIESEKGINTFGFGFPMLVRRDQADNKLTVAPVLIWSLKVRRTKEFNTWEIIRSEEDPIYINEVLINHLYNDAKVEVKQIPSELLDEGLIGKAELIDLCKGLISAINTKVPDDLGKTFETKLSSIQEIRDKKYYESLPLTSNNAFIDFGGLFSIFEVQKQNIIEDYDGLMELDGSTIQLEDLEHHTFQPISSVETDPSQQGILNALGTTRNILIQGPPGTGKSQSLTAILVNALENNRKVIVVCEKRTALEVLHKAIMEMELGYHAVLIKDIVRDRKTVVDSVRDRVDDSGYRRYRYNFSKESLDQLVKLAGELATSINMSHKKLDAKLIGQNSWTDVVGLLLKELRSATVEKIDFSGWNFVYSLAEMNELSRTVDRAQQLYSAYLPYQSISFLNSEKLAAGNPFQIEQVINTVFKSYTDILQRFNATVDGYRGAYLAKRTEEFEEQLAKLAVLKKIKLNVEKFAALGDDFKSYYHGVEIKLLNDRLSELRKRILAIKEKAQNYTSDPDFLDQKKTDGFFYKLVGFFGQKRKRILENRADLNLDLQNLSLGIGELPSMEKFEFGANIGMNLDSLDSIAISLDKLGQSADSIIERMFGDVNLLGIISDKYSSAQSEALANLVGQLMRDIPSIDHHDQLDAACRNTLSERLSALSDLKINADSENVYQLMESFDVVTCRTAFLQAVGVEFAGMNLLSKSANSYQFTEAEELQRLATELSEKIIADDWVANVSYGQNHKKFIEELDQLISKKESYFDHQDDPFIKECSWFSYYAELPQEHKALVDLLKGHQHWQHTFMVSYLDHLLVSNGTGELPTEDRKVGELGKQLQGFKKEQLNYIRQYWYSKQIDASREFELRKPSISVENLYNKRSSNRFARLSLRQIVKYDPDLFTTFFPIILTTPDVCSNLFKGMNGYFDMVIFDEASQLRLEDNLPAILKGKQIVVAGDEHQMPPSNYFSKIFDGSVEDEDDIEEEEKIEIDKDNLLLSCESLLDFATELNFEKRHLDFHYRSKHPHLIDFSNYAFYNQRLKPLPNTFDYVPIKYVSVGGTFSDHSNEAEAEAVLSIIEHNIKRLPNGSYPTVGVATFNIAQRNLIKGKIIERQKFSRYAEFNEKIQELGLDDPKSNKGFIKNLENIQGDETDVLILSTTYGLNEAGKFSQRFGPINQSKGYKLLNVIITRAKYKVYVCSSIPEEVILNYKEHLMAEGANNKKAAFYAYLAYAKAVSEHDLVTRKEVLDALSINSNVHRKLDNHHAELESPFEEEVFHELLQHFDQSKLIPQYQFAGFRIDIVYDSGIPGRLPIAIECDGSKYHSSEEAYLYDIYRQKILEQHGFIFHRIWSTNWWRNPQREINKLLAFIELVGKSDVEDKTWETLHSEHFPHEYNGKVEPNYSNDFGKNGFDFGDEPIRVDSAVDEMVVKNGALVKIKYLNADKVVVIQIGFASTPTNGAQAIKLDSPLAVSLLGAKQGDIRKVGTLDKYVEILEIS